MGKSLSSEDHYRLNRSIFDLVQDFKDFCGTTFDINNIVENPVLGMYHLSSYKII